MKHTYKLAIHQPTGCISQVLFALWDPNNLKDHVAMQIDDYRRHYDYEDTLHYTLYQRKTNSQAFTIIERDTDALQYPLF